MDDNFEVLRRYFKIDVAKYFTKALQEKYQDIKGLKESKIYDRLENKSKQQIENEKSFNLSIPVLIDVLLNGNCETENEIKISHDDLTLLKNIWKNHISENDVEKITPICMKEIRSKLRGIGDRMGIPIDKMGNSSTAGSQQNQSTNILRDGQENADSSVQIGNNNIVKIKGISETKPIFVLQIGDNNKMIVELEDLRQTNDRQSKETNRIVLRSSDSDSWKSFTEGALKLDKKELNALLKKSGIEINNIEEGCLVLTLNISGEVSTEECLKQLFEGLYRVLSIKDILQNNNVTEMKVYGYVYCPEQFAKEADYDRDLIIIRHLSWKRAVTKCDIDVYVSNFMKHLIQEKLYTNVDECIELQIKTEPAAGAATARTNSIKRTKQQLTQALKPLSLELQSLKQTGNTVHLGLKCTEKIAYVHFIGKDGPIVIITKVLVRDDSDTLIRLSVLFDVNLATKQGLLLDIKGLSKSFYAVDIEKLLENIINMLKKENSSMFKEDLKIKADLQDLKEDDVQLRSHSPPPSRRLSAPGPLNNELSKGNNDGATNCHNCQKPHPIQLCCKICSINFCNPCLMKHMVEESVKHKGFQLKRRWSVDLAALLTSSQVVYSAAFVTFATCNGTSKFAIGHTSSIN